jgi:hypothetical protein
MTYQSFLFLAAAITWLEFGDLLTLSVFVSYRYVANQNDNDTRENQANRAIANT